MVEWKEFSLEELCAYNGLVRGPFGGALKKEIFTDSGYKVYEQRNAIYETTEIGNYYISNEKYKELQRFSISEGDFIVSCSGTIGCIYRIPPNAQKGVINQALLKITVDEEKIDAELFQQYFRSEPIQKSITDDTQGGAMKNLVGMEKFKKTTFFIPIEATEQHRIAEALSEMDSYVISLEKLIAKKHAIKQGTMQELLTGKRRLEGFGGAWNSAPLGSLCILITDGSHESPLEVMNGYYMPSVKDMTENGFDFSGCKKISQSDYERLVKNGCRPRIDDVVIAKDGSILKYSFVLKKEMPIVILSSIAILRPDTEQISSEYLAHYFRQPKFIEYTILNYKTGTGVPRIVLKNFKEILIEFPQAKAEQSSIATILSDMDLEIDTLTTKLNKLKNIKQGMMSELLTGRIRLKEDSPSGKD